eukprot:383625_1
MQQKQAAKAFLVYKHLKKIEALEAYYLNISQQLFQQTLVVLTQYHQPIDNVHNVTSNTQCVNEISSNHQAQIAETNVCFGLNINNNSRNHNTNNPNSSTINAIKHNAPNGSKIYRDMQKFIQTKKIFSVLFVAKNLNKNQI